MSHFELMAILCTHLNFIFGNLTGNKKVVLRDKIALNNVPKYVLTSMDRLINQNFNENNWTDENEDVTFELLYSPSSSSLEKTPIYIGVAQNFNAVVVDKACFKYSGTESLKFKDSGIYPAIIIIIPKIIFNRDRYELVDIDDSDGEENPEVTLRKKVFRIISDIFSKVMALDPELEYDDSVKILNNLFTDYPIHTYDIMMALSAFAFSTICLNNWSDKELGAEAIIECYSDDEISRPAKDSIIKAFNKYALSVGTLRESIDSGDLFEDIMS